MHANAAIEFLKPQRQKLESFFFLFPVLYCQYRQPEKEQSRVWERWMGLTTKPPLLLV